MIYIEKFSSYSFNSSCSSFSCVLSSSKVFSVFQMCLSSTLFPCFRLSCQAVLYVLVWKFLFNLIINNWRREEERRREREICLTAPELSKVINWFDGKVAREIQGSDIISMLHAFFSFFLFFFSMFHLEGDMKIV